MDIVALGQGSFSRYLSPPPSLIVALKFAFVHLLGLMEQAVQKLQYKGLVSLYPENKKIGLNKPVSVCAVNFTVSVCAINFTVSVCAVNFTYCQYVPLTSRIVSMCC